MKTRNPHPLTVSIMELLAKKGPLMDGELFDLLKESYEDIGYRNLNQELMRMEIRGKVLVSSVTKGKKRIELVENKR